MSQNRAPSHVLNLGYIEELQAAYTREPNSVPPEWREYFQSSANGEKWAPVSNTTPTAKPPSAPPKKTLAPASPDSGVWHDRINQLIRSYRVRGHIIAQVHPIGETPRIPAELDPSYYGFSESDFERKFSCETLVDENPLTLRQILEILRNTYCRSIGVQYMHIDDLEVRHWLQQQMEPCQNRISLAPEIQKRIFSRLTDATIFEEFIRKKFLGAKSFSLEGSESLLPLLDLAIEKAGGQGVKEIVMGMAHRGRLNVLANIMGKHPRQIFREFADTDPQYYAGGGDVKYHLGHSNDWQTAAGDTVHLSLCFNPSHLEFVNPVALGRVRAKQDRVGDKDRASCMGLLIHGDAAFAGEGIVQETLNLSQLAGYTTGGTLHIIVNNQIGFTTSPVDARSCLYATDVARMLQVPIFHVNGEDPEAVAQSLKVAMDFRKKFKRDVFIDMYGYRKLGHNETDEPSFTQPVLYQAIAKRKPVREAYLEQLLKLGGITQEEADQIAAERREKLEQELNESRSKDYKRPGEKQRGIWSQKTFHGGKESSAQDVKTGVEETRLVELLKKLTERPAQFTPHPKLEKMRETWLKMAAGEEPLDWAAAEALAYASLATEGVRIRISGQDSRRGTFSHRHAVLHDYNGKGIYTPLQHLAPDQAIVELFNSPLSEAGVLGFDYGFSLDCPDGLVIWEAQFGDFVNGAQVIIDQFITSAEDKWKRLSGIVMLLPHGYEGMGPEHSSARLERFLGQCAEDNIQVANPSTPAQFFHLIRRQALSSWRKPLVVLTPKSMLRLPEARSSLAELAEGTFQRIIPDTTAEKATRVLMCSGKLFHELNKYRTENQREDVAIVRLEQYYPLKRDLLDKELEKFPKGTPLIWVQEEPVNMGAYSYLHMQLSDLTHLPFSVVARAESASPASGSASAHKQEQQRILENAFGQK
ncbi:MAG: 2-oxoglutarate dehydrogenase, subunit [Verrucomicrobia bacterium]|jgi:2-oxoglutarate dehydrogenase E1 component|nr:2-oxoglutarate dehydrogenase, subunit [Verrucomicrobiota bacterium]